MSTESSSTAVSGMLVSTLDGAWLQSQWTHFVSFYNDSNNNDNNNHATMTSCLALFLTIVLLKWQSARSAKAKERRFGMPYLVHPPQGRSVFFLGQALNFLKFRPWDLMMQWHHGEYGPIYAYPLFGADMFSIASPLLLKHVLQSQISRVKKDIANTMKPFLVILGTGIVTSEDDSWMKQRLKMSHPLRRDVLEIIPRQTLLAVQRLCHEWDAAADSVDKPTVPIGASLRHLTLQVISGSFLSLSAEESDSTFAKMYLPIVDESNARVWHPYRSYCFFLPQFWTNRRNVQRLNDYVSQLICKRWQVRREEERLGWTSQRPQDILDKVLATYEKQLQEELYQARLVPHSKNKQPQAASPSASSSTTAATTTKSLSENLMRRKLPELPSTLPPAVVRQFRDEMKTFMLAGHETSAAMMTWAFYEMLGSQSLMQAVRHEGCSVFGTAARTDLVKMTADQLPSSENLARLVLCQACLKESLRKYSVVPIVARRTVQDLYLPKQQDDDEGDSTKKDGDKYFVPKGSSFLINIQAVHHDARYWPEPMKFDPHRFLRPHNSNSNGNSSNAGDSNNNSNQEPFTFLPFIAGPRNCLGQHLALLESKMVLGMLTQRYTFTLPNDVQVELHDWSTPAKDPRHRYMVPVIPKQELLVHVSRNHPPT